MSSFHGMFDIFWKIFLLWIHLFQKGQGHLTLTATPSTLPRNANALGGEEGGSHGQGHGQRQGQRRPHLELHCSVEEPADRSRPALPDLRTVTRLSITYVDTTTPEAAKERVLEDASVFSASALGSAGGKGGSVLARAEVKLVLGLCEGAGQYRCYVEYLNTSGQNVTSHPPACANVSFSTLPGPMAMKVDPDLPTVPISSEITLTCSGSSVTGLEPPDVGIVWQWAAVDSGPFGSLARLGLNFTSFFPAPWDKVSDTIVEEEAGGEACKAARIRSTVVRIVTETDRFRTYRCYPTVVRGRTGDGGGDDGTGGDGLLRHLVDEAASDIIHTELPRLDLTIYPERLQFIGERTTQFYVPLHLSCYEHDRPMHPVSSVQIQLMHDREVLASVESGLKPRDENYNIRTEAPSSSSVSNNWNTATAVTISSYRNSHGKASGGDVILDRGDGWLEDKLKKEDSEDWSRDMVYNTDVQSDQLLFLTLTTYTVNCHSGGPYQCLFSYTFPVQGARPVVITQTGDIDLPVDVAPQRPNMTANMKRSDHDVKAGVELKCTAFVGGPRLNVAWVWQACRRDTCGPLVSLPGCKTCSDHSAITKFPAVFYGNMCQYLQTTRVLYTFKTEDLNGVEIKCYVIKEGVSYSPAVRKFFLDDDTKLHTSRQRNEPPPKKKYFNYLVFGVIPGMLSFGFLVYVVLGLEISRRRYERIQRRLHRSTVFRNVPATSFTGVRKADSLSYRNNQSRTDHFRKKASIKLQAAIVATKTKSSRPGRVDLIKSFIRTTMYTLQDKTETEIEEAGKPVPVMPVVRMNECERVKGTTHFATVAYDSVGRLMPDVVWDQLPPPPVPTRVVQQKLPAG